MKTIDKYVLSAMVIAFLTVNVETFAQVGIGTTNPDGSAMLDIQSNAKGVLIPRMTTSDRTTILTPANGLLVFDTNTQSFWFRDGSSWKELSSGTPNKIMDADGDTRVEVEKTADEDKILFTSDGIERMKIGNDGEILMGVNLANQATTTFQIDPTGIIKLGNKGSSTLTGGVGGGRESNTTTEENYTKITTDGSLSYVGNATRWDDLKVPVNAVRLGNSATPPTWSLFLGNTLLLWFDNSQDVVFTVQMPHGWKEGSAIFPHVHWTTKATVPGANRVTWELEYTWASVGQVFPATSIISGTAVAPPNEHSIALYEHVITPLGTVGIDATGKTLSSMLVCRLSRGASDTYGGLAGLLEIDFHYQIDSDGSNQEYNKE
jgi:hypothetical protein